MWEQGSGSDLRKERGETRPTPGIAKCGQERTVVVLLRRTELKTVICQVSMPQPHLFGLRGDDVATSVNLLLLVRIRILVKNMERKKTTEIWLNMT